MSITSFSTFPNTEDLVEGHMHILRVDGPEAGIYQWTNGEWIKQEPIMYSIQPVVPWNLKS